MVGCGGQWWQSIVISRGLSCLGGDGGQWWQLMALGRVPKCLGGDDGWISWSVVAFDGVWSCAVVIVNFKGQIWSVSASPRGFRTASRIYCCVFGGVWEVVVPGGHRGAP